MYGIADEARRNCLASSGDTSLRLMYSTCGFSLRQSMQSELYLEMLEIKVLVNNIYKPIA